jgi:hypothetical protein
VYYYISFCNPNLPPGSQFIGAALVEADDEPAALAKSHGLGIHPGSGSEAVFVPLDNIDPKWQRYIDGFIPAEVLKAEPHRPIVGNVADVTMTTRSRSRSSYAGRGRLAGFGRKRE